MNSILYEENLSTTDIVKIPDIQSSINTNQTSTTPIIEDIDIMTDEKHRLGDPSSSPLHEKQKSLISVYDNNPQQQSSNNSYPLIGIIGRNKRSQAFTKRLILSGFPKPILYDINSIEIDSNNNKLNYVSYETFVQLSPTIILITENITKNFEDLLNQNKQQLIIDSREIKIKYFSKKSSNILLSIPNSYRAFGNISNWEIENGTQRTKVAIEQYSSLDLIKFIYDLKCFIRGVIFLDQYSYNNQQIKTFRFCLFPFISTIIIFTLCFILSMIEHNNHIHDSVLIFRQASSITASTSVILLVLAYLIRPVLELNDFIYSKVLKKQNINENFLQNITFIQRWLQSRHYLTWYSLSFALLHILFIIFLKTDFNSKQLIYSFFFGLITLIFLFILSYVHLPWISERLLWNEYHFLTSYLGPFCLLIAFIHIYLYWKINSYLINLKFFLIILLLIILILRFIIYGIIYPIMKLNQWFKNEQLKNLTIKTKTPPLLP